jgi:type VI secretion system secreted protein Hcp
MASDFLLEIDGIKGESQDDKHKETIEIQSFSWGASNAGSFASNLGGGTGKVSMQDMHLTGTAHKGSPLLFQAVALGKHISKAQLHVRKSGGGAQNFYTIIMEDVLVSSYQSGGHDGSSSIPTEQFSLNFAKIEFHYQPQDAKGAVGNKVVAKHDLKVGKTS